VQYTGPCWADATESAGTAVGDASDGWALVIHDGQTTGLNGTLTIDEASTFTGTTAGQLAVGDVIDLRDTTAVPDAMVRDSGDSSPGAPTLSDAEPATDLTPEDDNSSASFSVSDDGSGGTLLVAPLAVASPTITSFSPESGVVGDGITKNTTISLTGTAAAGSMVTIFDGAKQVGTEYQRGMELHDRHVGERHPQLHGIDCRRPGRRRGFGRRHPSGFPDASTTGVPDGKYSPSSTAISPRVWPDR